MADPAWQTEYCVDTSASPDFAWAWMSDVANWDDPPAQFGLEGPFADGSYGTTPDARSAATALEASRRSSVAVLRNRISA